MKIDMSDGADWSALPVEPLERIFSRLSFRDRLACSLVCHHWNRALFSCPSLAYRIVLRVNSISSPELQRTDLQLSGRNYRQLSIQLSPQEDSAINECLAVAATTWSVRLVDLVGEPSQLSNCFRINEALFGGITELTLEMTSDECRTVAWRHDVRLAELKKLHYLQMYSGRDENVATLFRLSVPKLEFVCVVLDSFANEEVEYWENAIVEIVDCDQLKELEIDLNNTMWESFFAEERPNLERVLIRRACDEFQNRDWEQVFKNMPNLRHVELQFSNDLILTSVSRYCRKIRHVQLNGFSFHEGTFVDIVNWPSLEHLLMDGWMNGALFTEDSLLQLPNLVELHWKYVELMPLQGTLLLDTPLLRRLTLRECDFKRFQVRAGHCLESVDMDYYGNQAFAPNFFSSMRNLRHLVLHIDGKSVQLVQHLIYMVNLKHVEIIGSTEKHGYEFNALFAGICASSPNLEALLVRNEHENQLRLEFDSLAQLATLKRLKLLSLHYLTIVNVSAEVVRMESLTQLTVGGCAVLGTDGTQVPFPVVSDSTEERQWSVNEPIVV